MSAAAQFGSQHVHLVAHSKGGLWSRAFLASKPNNFGVYSLTTICTPHHGSVAADIAVAKHQVGLFNPLVYDPAKILPIYTPYSDSMIELQVAESESRNQREALPSQTVVNGNSNKINYFSIAADLNVDHSVDNQGLGTISCPPDDCSRLIQEYSMPAALTQSMYQRIQMYRSVQLLPFPGGASVVGQLNTNLRIGNDIVVSTDSAQYPNFQFLGTLPKNHISVLDEFLGSALLSRFTTLPLQQ